jgi:hypothetical protein
MTATAANRYADHDPAALGPAHAVRTTRPAPATVAPFLAVCGVCGGAGASTLSYLIARYAAAHGRGHALVCDTGGTSGGLAMCARIASPRTLPESASLVAGGAPLDDALWSVEPRAGSGGRELRVIATAPRWGGAGPPERFAGVLNRLRRDAGHALVVVDCGTLARGPERLALRTASHVAWVLPATARGRDCAQRLWAALPRSLGAREVIVIRRSADGTAPRLRTLTELAEARHAPLVLLPHVPPEHEGAVALAQVSLQAILGRLRR